MTRERELLEAAVLVVQSLAIAYSPAEAGSILVAALGMLPRRDGDDPERAWSRISASAELRRLFVAAAQEAERREAEFQARGKKP